MPDIGARRPLQVRGRRRRRRRGLKADPLARKREQPPATASIVSSRTTSGATTPGCQARARSATVASSGSRLRGATSVRGGASPRSRPPAQLRDLAPPAGRPRRRPRASPTSSCCRSMEHPSAARGATRSPATSRRPRRFGTPDDFTYFVDTCHQHGIGVILDWVPAHFPKDEHGLARFDGTRLYEHADPRQGEHPDWGTLIFNYGRNEVRNFLDRQRPVLARRVPHRRPARRRGRLDALPRLLAASAGEWIPNRYGGRENLEAIDFLRELNDARRTPSTPAC